MDHADTGAFDALLAHMRGQCAAGQIRATLHADQAMLDEETTRMKCTIVGCPGEYEARSIVHTGRHHGRVVVIDHVPADVCSACGDVLLGPETIRHIEKLLETPSTPASTVPLYEFAGSIR